MSKPARQFHPSIATANALRSGAVVYRAANGSWTQDLAAAAIAATPDAAATLLAEAMQDQDACKIVDPVLVGIRRDGAVIRPRSLREAIRAAGPTIAIPTSARA